MNRKEDKERVLGNLVLALHLIQKSRDFARLIPEVRVSLACAVSWAKTYRDVAAIEGRIASVGGYPRAAGLPAFGASSHMAVTILELRKYDPEIGAAMNFKCNNPIIEVLRQYAGEKNLIFGMIDRNMAPPASRYQGGHWKIRYMVDTGGGVPRVYYENEGMGKEPLSIVVGRDAIQVTGMALEIARRYRQKMKVEKIP
ncbi:MAG: thiamine-phosphate synthase family protein [Chloroflexota bacterium]